MFVFLRRHSLAHRFRIHTARGIQPFAVSRAQARGRPAAVSRAQARGGRRPLAVSRAQARGGPAAVSRPRRILGVVV
ncbi:hypothetical protein chiPu_0007359 [Chiloscyllium punctatum]|uniref:Uncharacterized protein n=1 Tax=Chiloscyllium punctatum TaxID=137246 RepID=A0A401SEU8_CHIPU|nr:hypothetical protein [Chiloscyllium punctatum]